MSTITEESSSPESRKGRLRSDLKRMDAARSNIMIAENILDSLPECRAEIALHILLAWQYLAPSQSNLIEASERWLDSLPLTEADVPRSSSIESIRQELESLTSSVRNTLEGKDDTVIADESALRVHLAVVSRVEARLRSASYGEHGFTRPIVQLMRFALALIALAVIASATMYLLTVHPWVVFLYDNQSMKGPVKETEQLKQLDVDWTRGSPLDGQKSMYSARFYSCLRLDRAAKVHMKLESDDGSRLFVAGKEVVNMWRPQARTAEEYQAELPAGVHPVLVEFFQLHGMASVKLDISVAGKDLSSSAAGALEEPDYTDDGTANCS